MTKRSKWKRTAEGVGLGEEDSGADALSVGSEDEIELLVAEQGGCWV